MSSPECKSAGAEALGPLFKLTEVYFSGDISGEAREAQKLEESLKIISADEEGGRSNPSFFDGLSDIPSIEEDVELLKQLRELGLPISFNTSKQKRRGGAGEKKKSMRKGIQKCTLKVYSDVDDLLGLSVDKANPKCHTGLNRGIRDNHEAFDISCNSSGTSDGLSERMLDVNDAVFDRKADDSLVGGISERSCLTNSDMDGSGCLKETVGEGCDDLEHSSDIVSKVVVESDAALFEETPDTLDRSPLETSGEWVTLWHDFYERAYYYNVRTEESTWDPPPCMEKNFNSPGNIMSIEDRLTVLDQTVVESSNDVQTSCSVQESEDVSMPPSQLIEIEEYISADNSGTFKNKRKKNPKKTTRRRNPSMEISKLYGATEDSFSGVRKGVINEDSPRISKYWRQRYLLFSKFDNGIKMDEEGWFSVTPEAIAKHHALRCGMGTAVDFFTGVGGNAIQFAQRCKHVVAIDIDPEKIYCARNNAVIYGVEDNIDFIQGDAFSVATKLKADVVFMSPPWGGPAYSKVEKFDMRTMLKPHDGQFLFNVGKKIAPKIVMFLPRNVDVDQLVEISLSCSPPWSLEVEKNFWNGRVKAVTAYFSEPHVEGSVSDP